MCEPTTKLFLSVAMSPPGDRGVDPGPPRRQNRILNRRALLAKAMITRRSSWVVTPLEGAGFVAREKIKFSNVARLMVIRRNLAAVAGRPWPIRVDRPARARGRLLGGPIGRHSAFYFGFRGPRYVSVVWRRARQLAPLSTSPQSVSWPHWDSDGESQRS